MGGSAYINHDVEPTMDNFYQCSFVYGGYVWKSSEQAYQAMKFLDKNHIQKICSETDIAMIYHLGQSKYVEHTKKWNENPRLEKVRLMYEVNFAKFSQNEYLKKILINSEGEIYFKGDRFWGKKGKGGLNLGGKILMKIRKKLIKLNEG